MPVISTIPTVTPPWLQAPTQATGVAQQPTQQPQQQAVVEQPSTSIFDYADTANKLFGNSGTNIFNFGGSTPLGSFSTGGIATGALSASGGTFVTGAGLAGEAGAIHTVAGAAGNLSTAGSIGLGASMAIPLGIAGFIGGKVLGSVLGGLFGSSPKDSWNIINSGTAVRGNDWKWKGTNNTHDLALGKIQIAGKRTGSKLDNPILKIFTNADQQIAQLFDQNQLTKVKQGISSGRSHNPYKSRSPKTSGITANINNAIMGRYSSAVAGLDKYWGGTATRVITLQTTTDATRSNVGLTGYAGAPAFGKAIPSKQVGENNLLEMVNIIANIDRDINSQSGVFAGTGIANAGKAMDYLATQYDIGGRPQPSKPLNRSKSAKKAFYRKYQANARAKLQAEQIARSRSYFSGNPLPAGMSQNANPYAYVMAGAGASKAWLALPAAQKASDEAKTGAWEAKILKAYVENYQQPAATNLQIQRDPSVVEQASPAISRGLLNNLSNTSSRVLQQRQTGGTRFHARQSSENDATNAGLLNIRRFN